MQRDVKITGLIVICNNNNYNNKDSNYNDIFNEKKSSTELQILGENIQSNLQDYNPNAECHKRKQESMEHKTLQKW